MLWVQIFPPPIEKINCSLAYEEQRTKASLVKGRGTA